jgi:hypothetical protein
LLKRRFSLRPLKEVQMQGEAPDAHPQGRVRARGVRGAYAAASHPLSMGPRRINAAAGPFSAVR